VCAGVSRGGQALRFQRTASARRPAVKGTRAVARSGPLVESRMSIVVCVHRLAVVPTAAVCWLLSVAVQLSTGESNAARKSASGASDVLPAGSVRVGRSTMHSALWGAVSVAATGVWTVARQRTFAVVALLPGVVSVRTNRAAPPGELHA
jgi:hypothetical protein